MAIVNSQEWQTFLDKLSCSHIMQTYEWGELKSAFGWTPKRIVVGENGAQILFRKLPLGFTIAYIPKGPLGPDWHSLTAELDSLCREQRSIFLKIEPDSYNKLALEHSETLRGYAFPSTPIQPPRTILIDLTGGEEHWLARMKQKTRYNIRLAEKKGVIVQSSDDLEKFYQLMLTTGERDEFGVHSLEYFQRAYKLFSQYDKCTILNAVYDGETLASIMVFAHQERAWYFYGASSNKERNRMPTYLLQWEAMRWAASKGCQVYDLWGIPDADESQLEKEFKDRSDGLWGVYRFKRGFGGDVVRSVGAFDRVYYPLLYRLYTLMMTFLKRREIQ